MDCEIVLPFPADLLQVAQESSGARAHAVSAGLLALPPGRRDRNALRCLTPQVRAIEEAWTHRPLEERSARELQDREREFDTYFRVHRIGTGAPAEHYIDALIVAYQRFVAECLRGHTLEPIELGQICSAVEGLIHHFAGPGRRTEERGADQGDPPEPGARGHADGALFRWQCGHHLFFVLIEGLILIHGWLRGSLLRNEIARAESALTSAADLWWAAAAALRFAADFPAAVYESVVRPSMSPPQVREGFSGMDSLDHGCLLQQLRELRPMLSDLPAPLMRPHQRYLWGLSVTYQAHAYVCERFVGRGPSLLQHGTRRAAADILQGPLAARALRFAGSSTGREPPPSNGDATGTKEC